MKEFLTFVFAIVLGYTLHWSAARVDHSIERFDAAYCLEEAPLKQAYICYQSRRDRPWAKFWSILGG